MVLALVSTDSGLFGNGSHLATTRWGVDGERGTIEDWGGRGVEWNENENGEKRDARICVDRKTNNVLATQQVKTCRRAQNAEAAVSRCKPVKRRSSRRL